MPFNRLDLVEIRGKRGRKVCVLITPDMKQAIDALNITRNKVGVHPNNPYIFSRLLRDSATCQDGSFCLREAVSQAGVSTGNITSTKLRKYTATVSQVIFLLKKLTKGMTNLI